MANSSFSLDKILISSTPRHENESEEDENNRFKDYIFQKV